MSFASSQRLVLLVIGVATVAKTSGLGTTLVGDGQHGSWEVALPLDHTETCNVFLVIVGTFQ